jgi:adenylate cyclase
MAEVFISYASSTAKQAQAIGEALHALGYSVWWDDDLPSHHIYAVVIEQQLKTAKAAVVVWSAEAAKSQWVRSKADRARRTRSLSNSPSMARACRCLSIRSSAPT